MINDERYVESLATALQDMLSANHQRTLIVISSDLNHYNTSNENDRKDIKVINAITNGVKFLKQEYSVCGREAILVAMRFARLNNLHVSFLAAKNSGQVPPFDKTKVVGYASAVFCQDPDILDETQQKKLLEIARKSLKGEAFDRPEDPALNRKACVFVTLTDENGHLMGCTGEFKPRLPLYLAVAQQVKISAYQDNRFDNAKRKPQDFKYIQISILSGLSKTDPANIVAGYHGVYVSSKEGRGTYLPEVAPENDWTKLGMLKSLCAAKAGLNPQCFSGNGTEVYTYSTQVMGE